MVQRTRVVSSSCVRGRGLIPRNVVYSSFMVHGGTLGEASPKMRSQSRDVGVGKCGAGVLLDVPTLATGAYWSVRARFLGECTLQVVPDMLPNPCF